jgi:zinc D-Ala-D-Ala carboxypeptidase
MPITMLTPHFTLEEFIASQTAARLGLPNMPTGQERANVQRTAEMMEKVRTILGDRPVLISSGYRSPQVNKAVGGSEKSAHMSGLAVDFTVPGFGTPIQICHKLSPLSPDMAELAIDQLIYEFNSWVHLGLSADAPRHMALTIDTGGTRTGFA